MRLKWVLSCSEVFNRRVQANRLMFVTFSHKMLQKRQICEKPRVGESNSSHHYGRFQMISGLTDRKKNTIRLKTQETVYNVYGTSSQKWSNIIKHRMIVPFDRHYWTVGYQDLTFRHSAHWSQNWSKSYVREQAPCAYWSMLHCYSKIVAWCKLFCWS